MHSRTGRPAPVLLGATPILVCTQNNSVKMIYDFPGVVGMSIVAILSVLCAKQLSSAEH